MNNLPWANNSWEVAAQIVALRARQKLAPIQTAAEVSVTPLPLRASPPQLLLQTVFIPGAKTGEGTIIEAVTVPWFEIIELLKKDPSQAFQIDARKWEEIIAGAYSKAGFEEVTLTPRSGDRGRDVIAIKKGVGSVRVIDQVKAYKPDHLVTADDVRALVGVVDLDRASKGFLTTTSDFAPKIKTDPLIARAMPHQIELINGEMLLKKLDEITRRDRS